MSAKNIILLAVTLAVLGLLAKQSNKPSAPEKSVALGSYVLEAFDINNVTEFERRAGESVQTLEKKEGIWVVSSLYDYPADFSILVEQVRALDQLKVEQAVYGAENSPETFGLGPNAINITLKNAKGKEIGKLSVGNSRTSSNGYGSGGHYVQATDGPIVLTEGAFDTLPENNEAWINKSLLKITPEQIKRISITMEEESYTLSVSNTTYSLIDAELPKGKQINQTDVSRLGRALQYLSCSSVVDPATPDEALGLDQPTLFEVEDTQGLIYTLRLGQHEANDFVALRLAVSAAQTEAPTETDAEDQTLFEAKDSIPEMDNRVSTNLQNLVTQQSEALAIAQEATEPLKFHKNWTYKISSYSAEAMLLTLDKILQDIPKEEPKVDNEES